MVHRVLLTSVEDVLPFGRVTPFLPRFAKYGIDKGSEQDRVVLLRQELGRYLAPRHPSQRRIERIDKIPRFVRAYVLRFRWNPFALIQHHGLAALLYQFIAMFTQVGCLVWLTFRPFEVVELQRLERSAMRAWNVKIPLVRTFQCVLYRRPPRHRRG